MEVPNRVVSMPVEIAGEDLDLREIVVMIVGIQVAVVTRPIGILSSNHPSLVVRQDLLQDLMWAAA